MHLSHKKFKKKFWVKVKNFLKILRLFKMLHEHYILITAPPSNIFLDQVGLYTQIKLFIKFPIFQYMHKKKYFLNFMKFLVFLILISAIRCL